MGDGFNLIDLIRRNVSPVIMRRPVKFFGNGKSQSSILMPMATTAALDVVLLLMRIASTSTA